MNDKAQHPMKDLKDSQHLSYLLRLWRTDGPGGFEWRASLETPETGKRIGFANLEQLFAYLMDLLDRFDRKQGHHAMKNRKKSNG